MYDFPSTLPVEIVSGTNKPPNTTAPALKTCMAGGLGKSIPLSLGENRQPLTCLKKKKRKKLEQCKKIIFRIWSYISTCFNGKFWCSVKDSELSCAFPFSLSHIPGDFWWLTPTAWIFENLPQWNMILITNVCVVKPFSSCGQFLLSSISYPVNPSSEICAPWQFTLGKTTQEQTVGEEYNG